MNTKLSTDLFTQVQSDIEKSQYQIRAILHNIEKEFQHNRIYPYLSQLIDTYRTVGNLTNQLTELRNEFPKRIKKIDFVNNNIEREITLGEDSDLNKVQRLIDWALPYIEATIEQGKTIYEFANKKIVLEEVGIMPSYTDEGYLFVPDNQNEKLLLFEYEMSIFRQAKDKYRSLKTTFLQAREQHQAKLSPNAIKLDLINKNKERPNPATYSSQTMLQFPFSETIFPIVKRKLIKQLIPDNS